MIRRINIPDRPRIEFETTLAGETFGFLIAWNDRLGAWVMDLRDDEGETILACVRLVVNYPLLRGYANTNLPNGELYVVGSDLAGTQEPRRDAWREDGQNLKLLFVESENATV